MDIRRRTIIPAWPLLTGLQVLILGGLIGLGLSTLPPRPLPLEERLAAVEAEAASVALAAALAEADSGRALMPGDEQRTTLFLQLLGQSAGMEVLGLSLAPGAMEGALQTVDAAIELSGDPYNLPIFLDGLQRQRAINHLVSLSGEGGARGRFSLLVRYYRPESVSTDWVAPRLAQQEPAHAEIGAVLTQAAELAVWRRFQWHERELVSRAQGIRRQVSRQLAAPLIRVRAAGGTVSWSPEHGARLQG